MQFKLVTFSEAGVQTAGLILGDRAFYLADVRPMAAMLGMSLRSEGPLRDLLVHWDHDFPVLQQVVAALEAQPTAIKSQPLHDLELCAPLVPQQTFCAIGNYRSHIIQSARSEATARSTDAGLPLVQQAARDERLVAKRLEGEPYMCFKLPSTISGPTDPLIIPQHARRTDWELELAVVIARRCRNVTRSEAMQYVAGYTIANDITVREAVFRQDVPKLGSDWLQSKNAPGFLPLGPFIVPRAFVPDPYALRMRLRLNGQLMQDALVADMLFDIASQIEYISRHAALLPGDVICTGTPGGCGTHVGRYLQPGDQIEASISGLGTQRVRCIAEPSALQATMSTGTTPR